MRIVDFETKRHLNDVGLYLTPSEIEELSHYLRSLASRPDTRHVHLSEILGTRLERELTVVVEVPVAQSA